MLVSQILGAKPTEGVVVANPKSAVAEVVSILSEKRIGTVVVSSDGKTPEGILSERDIVRELGRRGPDCLQDEVASMMTANPVTCTSDESADDVLTKMSEGRFRHMPVVEGTTMIGLISIGDVVKARLSELSMEKDALQGMIMGH